MKDQLRYLRLTDLVALNRLSHQAAAQDYQHYPAATQSVIARRNGWRPLLTGWLRGSRRTLVAVRNGRPVGYVVGTINVDGVAVVNWLYVWPGSRGGGLARQLLERFEADLPPTVHRLMVWTEVAADYYRRLGWQETAQLPDHWWRQTFWLFTKPRRLGGD